MDVIIYALIAIVYNIFAHNFANTIYQDYQYNEKCQNTLIMIVVFGCAGILISKVVESKNDNKKTNISKGLFYGGCLLLLTAFIANWDSIIEESKMFITSGLLLGLLWYAYVRDTQQNANKKLKKK